MRFQHFTCLNITEEVLGRTFSTSQNISEHWKKKMDAPEYEASGKVEQIFEEVRLKEYPARPSRKYCKFFFDLSLNELAYANSIFFAYEQYHLVEVEIVSAELDIARVNKSLLTCRIDSRGKLRGNDNEVVVDARKYWSGVTHSDSNEEILFIGKFKYTKILRKAEELFIPFLRKVG